MATIIEKMRGASSPMLHDRRLWIVTLLIAGLLVTAVLTWWPRIYTPAEINARPGLVGLPIDVVGKVLPGSLQVIRSDSVRFELQGGGGKIRAHVQGATPKNLDDAVLLKVQGVLTAHGTLEVVRVEWANDETP